MTTRKNTAALEAAALEAAALEAAALEAAALEAAVLAAALADMNSAANAVVEGKLQIDAGKAKGASALATMIVGFVSDTIAGLEWSFDIKTSSGDIHDHVNCTGVNEYGDTSLAWCRNGEGKTSKVAQTAYKIGLQTTVFNRASPAIWTAASKAIPMARAIREEGMTATIEGGELKLSGGVGPRADALRAAKSLAGLAKIAKGETGTNRNTPNNGKSEGDGEGETRLTTPAEVLALAMRLCEGVARGHEAMNNDALWCAREIAALVAANPDAFADDCDDISAKLAAAAAT